MTEDQSDGATCHVCGRPAVFRIAEKKEPIARELPTCSLHGRKSD